VDVPRGEVTTVTVPRAEVAPRGVTVPREVVDAEVVLVADRQGARTRLVTTRSAFPVALCRTGPQRVHLVGTGAWPLGGDRVRLIIEVGAGADLEVAAVAANVALPGRSGRPSVADVRILVAAGASLQLDLGPTIVAQGADHQASIDVELGPGASVALRELVILGRENEPGGRSEQRLDVMRDDLAVVRERVIRPDPGAPTFVDGGVRAAGSVLFVDGREGKAPASEPGGPCGLADGSAVDALVPAAGAVLALPDGHGWRGVALGDDVAMVSGWLATRWASACAARSRGVGPPHRARSPSASVDRARRS
jgi:urease accessory protein